jgi:hypothetical protein
MCLSVLLPIWHAGISRVQAQGTAATILGTVTDASGAAVADATISVKNVGTGDVQMRMTDGQGRYTAPDLPVGDFEVTAMKTGFSTVLQSGITLTVGARTVVDFSLAVGQQQQTITVQAEVSQVETSSAAVANLVESTQMRELPLNGRNFSQLLTLAPGVVAALPTGTSLFGTATVYAIAGARPDGQAYLLDNSDIQDWWNHGTGSGAMGTSLGVDGIGEFQTLTNTYSAQFGGNGSVINAVSKSGTNTFHGSAYEFLRNSDLDARNFFDGASPPAFRRNQFGGTVGGPVKKDKAFFFVNYEGLRSSLGQTQKAFVPDANAINGYLPCKVASTFTCNTGTNLAYVGIAPSIASTLALYPATSVVSSTGVAQIFQVASQIPTENYFLARFDYTFSDKDSLTARYVQDLAHQISPFPSNNKTPFWPETDLTANHFATVQERHIFRANLINQVTISFNRPDDSGSNHTQTPALNYWPASGWQDGEVTVSGMSPLGPPNQLPFYLIQNKFIESDDLIWTRGAHNVTFGGSVNRQQDNGNGPVNQSGLWAFTSLLNLMTAKPTTLTSGIPGQYDAWRAIRETPMAFYANDSWKATSRLTLNIGLRYEPATNPTEAYGNFNNLLNPPYGSFQHVGVYYQNNPYLKDFDPRLGFAFDPFKDHKTSIRGGFGMFHDPPTIRLLGSCSFATPPSVMFTQNAPTYPIPFTSVSASIPQITTCLRNRSAGVSPYMVQYNLNIQRDIGFGTILTVGYVGSRGIHLEMVTDLNAPISSGNAYGPYASIVNGAFVTNPRPNPAISTEQVVQPIGFSRYDSLQVSLQRRLANNWQAQLSYTGSHSYDTSSGYWGENGNYSGGAANPTQANWDLGTSSFNRANVIVANSVYMLPFKRNRLAGGWQVSGLLSYSSGQPLNVTNGINQEWTPQNQPERPNYIPGCNWRVGLPTEWYNPACFSLPPVGIIGNLGRYALYGPGSVTQDFSVMKDTKITEKVNLQFRAEFFNIFNHPNFSLPTFTNFVSGATPGTGAINPSAGIITTTVNSSRQIQFGLKMIF